MESKSAFKIAALLLFAALMAMPLHAMPRPHRGGDARAQILALEGQWRQAQLSDDIPAMEKLLSDNYIGITVSGQVVTKAQQLDRMRRRVINMTRFEMSDTKIKLIGSGKVAIVNSLAEVKGTVESRAIDGSFRYTRVYQRLQNGAWKITSFEATRVPRDAIAAPSPAAPAAAPPADKLNLQAGIKDR